MPQQHRPLLTVETAVAPPDWALLERRLIDAQSEACIEFYHKYFDERGYLRCIPRWGGDDGPDDAIENLHNWTVLHALGGPDEILELFRLGFEGHVRQYTEARTIEVPMAVTTTTQGYRANVKLPLPNNSSYAGFKLFGQSWFADKNSNNLGVVTSNAVELVAGTGTPYTRILGQQSSTATTGFFEKGNSRFGGPVVLFTGSIN